VREEPRGGVGGDHVRVEVALQGVGVDRRRDGEDGDNRRRGDRGGDLGARTLPHRVLARGCVAEQEDPMRRRDEGDDGVGASALFHGGVGRKAHRS
ncbi:unnamed protein product, partial [Urochloa humidicola]